MTSPHQQQQQHGLVAALAAALEAAERPGLFAAREGSLLRLVPPNERLTHEQITELLEQLLTQQPYAQQLLLLSGPKQRLPRLKRHTAAWLRGCCYLGAGNSRQALRDAHAAMAYATAAAEKASPPVPCTPAPASAPTDNQPVTAAATSLVPTAAEPRSAQAAQHSWWPALLLAGQACMAALGDHAQAVVHLAEAARLAPPDAAATVSCALQEAVRGLSADQGYAWAIGGLAGLQQQLQDEADMKLPEVLRPRPKWYYYKQWMRQRIHLALLELHLASDHSLQSRSPTQHLPSTNSSSTRSAAAETSTSSTRGRLLLSLLAEGGAEAPAVAAAAAAAGFCQAGASAAALALPAAAAANKLAEPAAGVAPAGACRADSGRSGSRVLQLPEAVVDKLLSVDAGDLDLMVQHPVALQGQVYELLEVLKTRGPEALQDHTIQPLTWEEVQGLAGGVVGLPLGYTPAAAAAVAVLPLPAPSSSSSGREEAALLSSETRPAESEEGAAAAGGLQLASVQQGPGWTRAQYVRQALCAQEAVCRGAAAAAAEGV